jgi:hypothetical protein
MSGCGECAACRSGKDNLVDQDKLDALEPEIYAYASRIVVEHDCGACGETCKYIAVLDGATEMLRRAEPATELEVALTSTIRVLMLLHRDRLDASRVREAMLTELLAASIKGAKKRRYTEAEI